MRPLLLLLLASLLLCVGSEAAAQPAPGAPGAPGDRVTLTIEQGVARFVVERDLTPAHRDSIVAQTVHMPHHGVVVSLEAHNGSGWHPGVLMPTDAARERFFREPSFSAVRNDMAALLSWGSPKRHLLDVRPIPEGGRLRYTVLASPAYRQGRYLVSYPVPQSGAPPRLRVRHDDVRVNGARMGDGDTITLQQGGAQLRQLDREGVLEGAEHHAFIEIPARFRGVDARLGRVVAGAGKELSWLEANLAAPLRPLPKRLSVIFVMDGSHSMGPQGIAAQIGLVRSFLHHVPDARFDIVVYRRHARALFGRLSPAAEVLPLLDRARQRGAFTPDNGSALDEGLRLAVERLRRASGPSMMVVLGDFSLRGRFNREQAQQHLAGLPHNATVHLAHLAGGAPSPKEQRHDTHTLAPLALRHGGVLLQLRGIGVPNPHQLDHITLGLVRPIRIDHLRVEGRGVEEMALTEPHTQPEGESLTRAVWLSQAPRELVLRGQIWSKPFRQRVVVSTATSKQAAGFVFGMGMHWELDDAQQMRLAKLSQVVSPVTSYIVPAAGKRLDVSGVGFGSRGRLIGRRHAHRLSAHMPRRITPKVKPLVMPLVKHCKRVHTPEPGWNAVLTLELTKHEIVDVQLRGRSDATARCVVDAVWGLQLQVDPGHPRRHHTVIPIQ